MKIMKAHRTPILPIGMLGSILMATSSLANPVQWSTSAGGNGHWYEFRSEFTPWNIARDQARLEGGHLATVQNLAENNFVKSIVPYSTWIGGTDEAQEGTWVWENGEPWNYTNWGNSEPNNNGAEHYTYLYPGYSNPDTTPMWYDGDLNATIGYTVEWSADCNGDGLVDYGQILDGSLADDDGNGVPDICENTSGIDSIQWSTSSGGNGHWYAMFNFSDDDSSIFDAQDIAESIGGNVASVRSSMENNWIYQTFGNTRFGAYQDKNSSNYSEPNGGWAWISGEPWDYTTWLSGEPNNGSGNEDGVAVCCGGNWNLSLIHI